jgi:hypothetical protein
MPSLRRLRAHHPRYRAGDPARDIALHDAQLVIAREYGFASWPRWKQFVEARQLRRRATTHPADPAPTIT